MENPQSIAIDRVTAVVNTLDGVTTVVVAFLFVCLIFPSIVKNRSQYYAALAMILLVILFHGLTLMLTRFAGFAVLAGVATVVLQIGAILLLVLSVGGLTVRQLAGDMSKAYEVMRRGETEKEVIIPIGDQLRPRREPERNVYSIDTEPDAGEEK